MIIDDDVAFGDATSLEVLVGHLQRDASLALVAGCYVDPGHQSSSDQRSPVCYSHDFDTRASNGRLSMQLQPVSGEALARPIRAQLVQNAFVARSAVLASHPWDDRQVMTWGTRGDLLGRALADPHPNPDPNPNPKP